MREGGRRCAPAAVEIGSGGLSPGWLVEAFTRSSRDVTASGGNTSQLVTHKVHHHIRGQGLIPAPVYLGSRAALSLRLQARAAELLCVSFHAAPDVMVPDYSGHSRSLV